MSWVWYERSPLYLIGVAVLVLATLGFGLGHVAPFWVRVEGDQTQNRTVVNRGLWFFCQDLDNCVSYSFAADPDFLKATRILQILGLLVLVTAVGVAIFANCRRQHPDTSFFLEMVIVLGGVLGFSGSMVYLGATREAVDSSSIVRYDWAFAVSVGSSLLALLSAVLVFIANMRAYLYPSSGDQDDHAGGLSDEKQSSGVTENPTNVYSGTTESPSSLEPPRDYHTSDPAVYHMPGPAWPYPLGNLQFPPERYEERRIKRKVPPPPVPRRSYEDLGRVGVPVEPVRYPVTAIPTRAFILPRVVVRGFHDSGYGFPAYNLF
ncbi:hypothetical protein ACOMHN_041900 [Nucella lapillus]